MDAIERELRKLKAAGVTIMSTPAPGREAGFEDRVFGRIQAVAERLEMTYDATEPESETNHG
jgi:hypothetical protein